MPNFKSQNVSRQNPAPVPVAQEDITVREKITLTAAQVAINNVLELAVLPANCVPVDYVLIADDLDSGGSPTSTIDLGILTTALDAVSTAAADGGDEWVDGSNLTQAGGILLATASKAANEVLGAVQPAGVDRVVGVKLMTASATPAAGSITLQMTYRSTR